MTTPQELRKLANGGLEAKKGWHFFQGQLLLLEPMSTARTDWVYLPSAEYEAVTALISSERPGNMIESAIEWMPVEPTGYITGKSKIGSRALLYLQSPPVPGRYSAVRVVVKNMADQLCTVHVDVSVATREVAMELLAKQREAL